MKRKIKILGGLIIGLVLIGIWLMLIDVPSVVEALNRIQWIYSLPLGLIFIAMYFIRSLRWKVVLSPIEKITAGEAFKLCMTNYFVNFLIPVHAGEIAKSYLLKKMKGTPVSRSLLTVYLDKMTELLPVFLLLAVAPFLNSKINSMIFWIAGIVFLIFLFTIACLVMFALKKNMALNLVKRILVFLPERIKKKVLGFMELFFESILFLPQLSKKVPEILGLTFLALACHCFFLWLFFFAFGVTLPPMEVFVGYLLLNAFFLLPAPPGFAGSLELTVVFIFSYLFHYDKNIVSAVAASSHVYTAVLFGLLGFLSMALIGTSLSALLKIKPDERKGATP